MKKSNNSQRYPDSILPSKMNSPTSGLDDLYHASARQDLDSIEQALGSREYGAMQHAVHRLKGAAMIFRMTLTVNAALHVEAVLNTGLTVDHVQLTKACALLRRQIERQMITS